MEIISIVVLGLLVWLGTRILVNTLVKGNKADDIIGSTVKVNMSDRDKIFNRFNNAESPEKIDMIWHEINADNERWKINKRMNNDEYMQRKKDEHIKAFGGYFKDNKFISAREESK